MLRQSLQPQLRNKLEHFQDLLDRSHRQATLEAWHMLSEAVEKTIKPIDVVLVAKLIQTVDKYAKCDLRTAEHIREERLQFLFRPVAQQML